MQHHRLRRSGVVPAFAEVDRRSSSQLMKIPSLAASLLVAVCLIGCSKSGGKAKGMVPATAAELAAIPEFKLEHTTKSGVKCYVREISAEVAKTITERSPDHPFLSDENPDKPYLLVVVNNGKICDLTAEDSGLTMEQGLEVSAWAIGKLLAEDKEFQEMLKKAGK